MTGSALLAVLWAGGPAFAQGAAAPPADGTMPATAVDRLRVQAMALEKNMELPDALMRWRFIRELRPDDKEAAVRMEVIQAQINTLSVTHFARGVAFYKKRAREDALREFLLVLNYNPDNPEAIDYIRNKLKPPDWVYYTVVAGDTMKGVAKKAYQDEQKEFMVATYNNLSRTAELAPGQVLQLPIIEQDLRKASVNVPEVLVKAKALMDQKNYGDAIAAAESILVYEPQNTFARDLINLSNYNQAKELAASNKPVEALAMFKNVDAGYRDTRENMASIQNSLKAVGEDHYKKGVAFFIKEDLDSAIKEWETTLSIDPGHAKANQDLEKAKALREKLKKVQ
jgi:tetratricopeptide (TPR) repeat protein